MADKYNPRTRPSQPTYGYDKESRAVPMSVVKVPTDDLALINCLIVATGEFEQNVHYVLLNGQYVFTIR